MSRGEGVEPPTFAYEKQSIARLDKARNHTEYLEKSAHLVWLLVRILVSSHAENEEQSSKV